MYSFAVGCVCFNLFPGLLCIKSHLCIAIFTATFVPAIVQGYTSSSVSALHSVLHMHHILFIHPLLLSTSPNSDFLLQGPCLLGRWGRVLRDYIRSSGIAELYDTYVLGFTKHCRLLFKVAVSVLTCGRWAGRLHFWQKPPSQQLELFPLPPSVSKLFICTFFYSFISFARSFQRTSFLFYCSAQLFFCLFLLFVF